MNFSNILKTIQLVILQTVDFEVITSKGMSKNKEDQKERNALYWVFPTGGFSYHN